MSPHLPDPVRWNLLVDFTCPGEAPSSLCFSHNPFVAVQYQPCVSLVWYEMTNESIGVRDWKADGSKFGRAGFGSLFTRLGSGVVH